MSALRLLFDARALSDDVHCDPWEFAVSWETLRESHVSLNDLRWLLYKGYVVCKVEKTASALRGRRFCASHGSTIGSNHSFVLTASGEALARENFKQSELAEGGSPPNQQSLGSVPESIPFWDKDRRTLFFGDEIIKEFRVPAPSQETILSAFQEEGWPPQVDDPLPPRENINCKRRLHDTIGRLNHKHRCRKLRFIGNGTGEAVRWIALDVASE